MSEDAAYGDTPLPDRAADDTDLGWGEESDEPDEPDESDERLLREKPPHW